MKLIMYSGWSPGMRKIKFIHLLNDAGLSLSESKMIKDKIVDKNETVVVKVTDDRKAEYLLKKSLDIGLQCKFVDDIQKKQIVAEL